MITPANINRDMFLPCEIKFHDSRIRPCLFPLISGFSVQKSKKPTQTSRLKSDCLERRFRGNHGDNVNHDSHQRVPELASLVSDGLFSLLPFVSLPDAAHPCCRADLGRRRPAGAGAPRPLRRRPAPPSLTPDLRRPRASCAAAPFFPPLEQRRRPLTHTPALPEVEQLHYWPLIRLLACLSVGRFRTDRFHMNACVWVACLISAPLLLVLLPLLDFFAACLYPLVGLVLYCVSFFTADFVINSWKFGLNLLSRRVNYNL